MLGRRARVRRRTVVVVLLLGDDIVGVVWRGRFPAFYIINCNEKLPSWMPLKRASPENAIGPPHPRQTVA